MIGYGVYAKAVIRALHDGEWATGGQLAKTLGVPAPNLKSSLIRLVRDGLVREDAVSYPRRFRIECDLDASKKAIVDAIMAENAEEG